MDLRDYFRSHDPQTAATGDATGGQMSQNRPPEQNPEPESSYLSTELLYQRGRTSADISVQQLTEDLIRRNERAQLATLDNTTPPHLVVDPRAKFRQSSALGNSGSMYTPEEIEELIE